MTVFVGFAATPGVLVDDLVVGWFSLFADVTSSAFSFALDSRGFGWVSFFSVSFTFCGLSKPLVG